MERFLVLSD